MVVVEPGGPPAPTAWATVRTFLPRDALFQERVARIDVGVRLVSHLSGPLTLQERVLEDVEWASAWKEHFRVLRVGRRTVVVPTWLRHESRDGEVVIDLDPGMAFGTGHHPTTRMCLEALEDAVSPGLRVLDVGCGSGILSIAAAKLGAAVVTGLDTDALAVQAACGNALHNGVRGTVSIFEGSLPHDAVDRGAYDLVVANISARVVSALAGEFAASLRAGGTLIASGITREHEAAAAESLAAAGLAIGRSRVDGDWLTLAARLTPASIQPSDK